MTRIRARGYSLVELVVVVTLILILTAMIVPVARFNWTRIKELELKESLRTMRTAIDERGWGFWCLEIEGQCAGFTGLNQPTFDAAFLPAIEIGWRMLRHYWGRGLAAEAARLALQYGFDVLKAPEIVAWPAG